MNTTQIRTWIGLMALALPALIDPGAIQRAAELHELATSPNPYLVSSHAALLYCWAPLVAVGACALFLSPGLLAAAAIGEPRSAHRWVLHGLALSIGIVSIATLAVQSTSGFPLRDRPYGWFVGGLSLAIALVTSIRPSRARTGGWPSGTIRKASLVASFVAVPFVIAAALAPKFYWEVFNGDGAHAFESTRLLLVQPVPFFAPQAASEFPGLTSMLFAFPGAWFVRLFGEIEAAVRLPYLLYLPALYAALSELATVGRDTDARVGQPLIWLSLVAYTLSMAFSATYSPYSTDIALPATQDTLLVVCVLGAILAFIEREPWWVAAFAALTYVSLPSGLLLLGMWMVAVILVWRPLPVRALVQWGGTLALCVVAGAVAAVALRVLALPAPGSEYGAGGLLRYFAFLQFTDLRRFIYVALPGGLLPALSLLLWRRQDRIARALTLVSAGYFLFFYVQANVSLHHFVPSMLLPIPVLWRTMPLDSVARRPWLGAAAVAGVIAAVLCLPSRPVIDTSARVVGAAIEDRLGGYAVSSPAQMAGALLLDNLFPKGFDPRVPAAAYGGSPLAWNHYARHVEPPDAAAPALAYVLQKSDRPAPSGALLVAHSDTAALYVRDQAVWQAHLSLRPPTPPGSRWLAVPRSTLFRSVPATGGPRVYDVVAILHGIGFDTDAIMRRLGVRRAS